MEGEDLVSFNESGGVGGDKLNGEVQWWLEKLEKERVHSDYCESVGTWQGVKGTAQERKTYRENPHQKKHRSKSQAAADSRALWIEMATVASELTNADRTRSQNGERAES
ncbi:hypothetical protein IMY05_007G0083400 [Salix suchowensis]|nr:hypothetical protein IMY05_007G0083400 [Salix suchowensis]